MLPQASRRERDMRTKREGLTANSLRPSYGMGGVAMHPAACQRRSTSAKAPQHMHTDAWREPYRKGYAEYRDGATRGYLAARAESGVETGDVIPSTPRDAPPVLRPRPTVLLRALLR